MTYIVRTCSWSLQVTSLKLHALAAGNAQFSLFWGSMCCLSLTKASACWLGKPAATSIGLDGMCADRFAVHVYTRPPSSQQNILSVEIVLKFQKVRQHSSCIRVWGEPYKVRIFVVAWKGCCMYLHSITLLLIFRKTLIVMTTYVELDQQ